MVITSAINIDMQYKYVNAYVDAVQYDVNSRNVEITLLKAGNRVDVPVGSTFEVKFKRPDGSSGSYSELSNGQAAVTVKQVNIIVVWLSEVILSEAGTTVVSVCIKDGETEINTFSFNVNVQESPSMGTGLAKKYPNTYDATATPSDISDGKTAYVNGEKVSGTAKNASTTISLRYGISPEPMENTVVVWQDTIPQMSETYPYLWIEISTETKTATGGSIVIEKGIIGYYSTPGSGGNANLTPELRTALINYYTHVMPNFDDANGLAYINAILTALGAETRGEQEEPDEPVVPDDPEVTLSSISAVYSGGDVTAGTAVTDLTGIVVTAHYSDGTRVTVTDYTLSGEIAEGSNTITVSYGGLSTTFAVTGVAAEEPEEPSEAVYVYSLELGNMLLHMGGHGMSYNTASFHTLAKNRITPYTDSGINPGYYQPDPTDKTHFPFAIPADATGVTVTVEPAGYCIAPAFLVMTEQGYNRLLDPGWAELTTGQQSYSFEAGTYTHFFNGTKMANGGNFPENPFTAYKIEFTK